nr:TRAP transporter fused permease subunit [Lachnospiraceae bacterium]
MVDKIKNSIKENWRLYVTVVLGIALLVIQYKAMLKGNVQVAAHRVIFTSLCAACFFLNHKSEKLLVRCVNWLCFGISIAAIIYALLNGDRWAKRIQIVSPITTADIVICILLTLVLLIGTRRIAGNVLTIITVIFIAYGFFGKYLPGALTHKGFSIARFTEINMLTTSGTFGIATGTVATTVFFFVLFTTFLELSGGGKLFIDLAVNVCGRMRGGTAKGAIVSAALMGMINGSATANVSAVGPLTLPIMKKHGFDRDTAGGIVAASSTGGLLMPPVMGAAAFIMAENTGTQYSSIIIMAIFPAILYYFGIFQQTDFYSRRNNIEALSKEELPDWKDSLKRYGLVLIPLVVLVYFIISGNSIMMSGLKATGVLIVLSMIRKETRLTPKKICAGIAATLKGMVSIVFPCAAAGLIVGTVINSSLANKISALFVTISGGNVLICMLCCMVVCIIFGMGMPSSSAYILVAMLMAPTLIKLGIPLMAAHFFVFYFAILSFVTPPVALAAYAAAGIAEGDAFKTGFKAFKFTFAGFIIPFIFCFDQGLLMMESMPENIIRFVLTGFAVYLLSGVFENYYFVKPNLVQKILAAASAICLAIPVQMFDYIGLAGGLVVIVWLLLSRKKAAAPAV